MKTKLKLFIIVVSLLLTSTSLLASSGEKKSRVGKIIAEDITERLENIAELNTNLRSLNLQLKTLNIALEDAKKQSNRKGFYTVTKRVADATSAITTLAGAVAAARYENKTKVFRITSVIFGVSSGVSVLAGLAAELAPGEVTNIQLKINEARIILEATEKSLELEIKLLCQSEPSNQMCM